MGTYTLPTNNINMPIPPLDKYYLNSSNEFVDSSGNIYTKNDLKTEIRGKLNVKDTNVQYIDNLVELITNYYISLLENKKKTKQLQELEISQTRITASLHHTDGNFQYKTKYINIVNLSVGILVLLGGLFVL
jgi:hypothetical protein